MTNQTSFFIRLLNALERAGNRLPHPTLLFIYLCALIIALSAILAAMDIEATHPANGSILSSKSLLSGDGIRWMLTHTVDNFVSFAPVGTVLVAILGIGLAEHSGLLGALLRGLVARARGNLLTAGIVFAGVLSSLGADSGYVVLVPLAGFAFASAGRHPLAGIAAAFAGVSGGYSANLAIGPLDAILAGLSTEAVKLVADTQVTSSDNYYFMLASTLLITALGTLATQRWVEPRLGRYQPSGNIAEAENPADAPVSYRWTIMVSVLWALLLLAATLPDGAVLRNQTTDSLIASPFLSGIVTLIALTIATASIAFGMENGRYRSATDWIEGMEQSIASMASYLVLMFFAAQFVNYFAWSGMGAIAAVKGANLLTAFQLPPALLLIVFIGLCAAINLLIGSASAKWALLAPVFVPMLYLLGVSPEAAQLAYRIGDSSTNIITPLMPYFGVVVAFAQRYDKSLGIGTLMAMMLPYSLLFLAGWTAMLLIWMGLDWPLGPGGAGF